MALFKIFKGNQTSKLTDSTIEGYRVPTDGYAYYDTSTRKFYIDADYDNNGTITRQPINAYHADGADAAILARAAENDDSGNEIVSFYAHSLKRNGNDIVLTNALNQDIENSNISIGDKLDIDATAYRTASIPIGQVDSTSTATVFTAEIPGITELRDGVCIWLRNGVVTSTEGFTININDLGAKPCYSSLAAAARSTTIFNINYTMLLIYNETRVTGGCWDVVYGYDSNTNTIGYQLRTNSTTMPTLDKFYRQRLLFTAADGKHLVPANTSSSTNATASRTVNQRPIDPFGAIYYYGHTTSINANANPTATYFWTQYNFNLGYSFNRTGAANTLTNHAPVYIKCAPQANGSAIIDSTTPFVQTLPTTADGKIYIFLGIATSAENVELVPQHPIYCYRNNRIQIWTGLQAEIDAINVGVTNITTGTGLTGGPITSTGTINLANNYGDTKNPYGDKMANYILAGPATGSIAGPVTFRKLVAADIPSITKSKISDFPTDLSDFTNNAGYLTQETDPTVPSWAKAENKPSYSLSEITGAEDVQAIEALNGTSGFLKKTGEKSWALDTNTYVTQSTFNNLNVGVTSISVNNGLTATPSTITSTGTIGINGVDTTNGSTTKVLTQKATWVELPTAASLGLSNAMHFIGITSTNLTDGSTTTTLTAKSSGSLTKTTGFSAGDVVIDTNSSYEYVWTGSSWERLGPDGSYKVLQTPITDNTGTSAGDETATRFIYSFSQDENGVVSVKTRSLPTYNNYVLTKATDNALGGIQTGYSESGKNYAVKLDTQNKAYVSVPWTNSGGTVKSITIKTSSPLTGGSDTATTTSGSYTIGFSNQNVNYVLAGPSTGSIAGAPTFRKLVAADIPSITKSKISDFPTQVSSFTNDAGYLTQETDPTVPSWAKAENKPSYSLSEINNAEDIQAIEALNETGFLVRTGTNTWTLDQTQYVTETDILNAIHTHEDSNAAVWNFVSSDGLNDNATITLDTSLMSLIYAAQQKHLQFYVLWETTNSHVIKFEIDEINMATNTAKFHSNCGNILYTIEINSNSATESPMTGILSVRTISDTKNTAGSTDISSKIYLIGAASQTTNSVTYSDNEVYATNGVLTAKTLQGTSLSASQSISTDANKNLISSDLTTTDPTANGTGITYITSISQNAIGKITASKSTVRSATTSQTGVVQLTDSVNNTSITTAATPNSVKTAYDLANSHKYWANIESTLTAVYDKQPEVKSIKIGNGTTTTATKSVQLIYDATLEALNFVFA